jgi:NMD protein affecting ribosome stability and mRNA decay
MSLPRSMRCQECGRDSLDSRWSPLCPVCYESLHHEQRREQVRPPALEVPAWSDPERLDAAFEKALGRELP